MKSGKEEVSTSIWGIEGAIQRDVVLHIQSLY